MREQLLGFFDTSDFPARWHCGRWSHLHGAVHIAADIAIFLAYLAIPLCIWVALAGRGVRRYGRTVERLGFLFIVFIISCGLTHLNEAIIFYYPFYRFAAVIKVITAIVSWATVAALVPALPILLAMKTPKELEQEIEAAVRALGEEKKATRSAEELVQLAVDATPTGMLAVDKSGVVVLANAEVSRLFGHERTEILGKPVESLLPLASREAHPALRDEYFVAPLARKMGNRGRLHGVRKDGSVFPLEVGLNPIQTDKGLWVLAAIVDRTEAVRKEEMLRAKSEQLERTNEELEGFASAASHDLKAPLRAIQNAVHWLEEDLPEESISEDAQQSLLLLKNRASRMELLLDALLEYARAGQTELASESFSAEAAVDEVVFLLGPRAQSCVKLSGELPVLGTPRAPFEQVMSNLISNAIKHGSERNDLTVQISARAEGEFFCFEVADNGPGIEPRFHAKIFEVFQTLRSRDEVEGAGMGLALVKKLVERFGGKISVANRIGGGAVFSFTWPVGDRPSALLAAALPISPPNQEE